MNEVKVAAVWLDATRPGWAEEIDLSTLDQGSGHFCIGGQLAGAVDESDDWQVIAAEFQEAVGDTTSFWNGPFGSSLENTQLWADEVRARLPRQLLKIDNSVDLTYDAEITLHGDLLTISDGYDSAVIDLSFLR